MSRLTENMLSLLGEQYQHETANSLRYYQRSMFAEYIGLLSIAEFFRKQANDERSHADKIMSFVNSRSMILPISGLSFTDKDLTAGSDILGIFRSALDIEKDTSARLENILDVARTESDTMTEQWLMDADGLIKEQIEEENLYQTILDHASLISTSPSLYHDLDNFVKNLL